MPVVRRALLATRRQIAVSVLVAVVVSGVCAASASAHAFLIRSQPQAGARLTTAPSAVSIRLSQPFVAGTQQVTIRRARGGSVELIRARGAGNLIGQPLPANLRGIFIASWRVISSDGHVSAGQFAFAVGSTGPLPRVTTTSDGTSWSQVIPSWLLFIGLAFALGGLLSELFVFKRGAALSVPDAPAVTGVILASAGSALELVQLAGLERGGGLSAGLNGGAIEAVFGTRPGGLTLATLIALVLAGVLVRVRSLRPGAIVPLLVAVVLSAERGHSGTSATGWAVIADSVHLAAVSAWVGGLAHLVLVALRSDERRAAFMQGAHRYSQFALPTVLVVLASGVLTAIPEFRSINDVVSTGYGRTLLIKAGVIALALLLAFLARTRGLKPRPSPRTALLRRLGVAEATTLLAALIVVAVLVNAAPPRAPAESQAPASLLGPPPVTGPTLRLAEFAGQLVVSVTAGPRELQFVVFAPGYQSPGAIELTADARQPDGNKIALHPLPCGTGCFSIPLALGRGLSEVTARASSSNWRGGQVSFAIPWPLGRQQPAVIRRVSQTLRATRSLRFDDQVTLPFGTPQPARAQSISGRQFLSLEPLGEGDIDVRPVGTYRGLTEYAFIYPVAGSTIWYRIWIDRSYRLRRELIVGEQGRIYRTFR